MITRPTFEHPVFEQLYERDYFIDDEVLREILALGLSAAVPELLKITSDTLDDFLYSDLAATDWLDAYYFHHALHLLHELHAPEALDVYGRLLRLDAASTDFWFGDDLFEEMPDQLARAGQTRLPELLAMLEDEEMLLMHRLVVSEAVSRLARAQPELRPAIVAFMQPYLRHIITHADQAPQLFPTDAGIYHYDLGAYLGSLLFDMQEAGLPELEPEMRELHRLGLVDERMAGGEDKISFHARQSLRPARDIFARYQHLRDYPESDSPFHPDAAGIAERRAQEEARYAQLRREHAQRELARQYQQPRQAAPKVGRNDPCPCGSGKKYKKCHGA